MKAEAQFLLDRLDEFDPSEADAEREYHGHVAPAIARLRDAVNADAQGQQEARGDLTKIAAECHRAKWQFDLSEDFQPSKASARALILQAFHELHRIGDLAMKARDAYSVPSRERS